MTSPDADADPLALRDRPVVRLAVVLPADTALALYHYCLRSGADEAKLPVAVVKTDNVLPKDEFTTEKVDRRRRDE